VVALVSTGRVRVRTRGFTRDGVSSFGTGWSFVTGTATESRETTYAA
jgi:hypothetical protein